jgi:FdhD protein
MDIIKTQDLTDTRSARSFDIARYENDKAMEESDWLAVEEPLEIRLASGPEGRRRQQSLAVTMRTPGRDRELALGFLFSEAVIGNMSQVQSVAHAGDRLAPEARENVLVVELKPDVPVDIGKLNRHFYTSSSCGVCGKTSLEMVDNVSCYYPRPGHPSIAIPTLHSLPGKLRHGQPLFACTGGNHAAGLFDPQGNLLVSGEDIGRHNAVDKIIGKALMEDLLPLRDHVLMLSGRAGFELVQKAVMAGIPILAAVGAPSSLAVELAKDNDMTLIGFMRDDKFNVYCGHERLLTTPGS